MASHSALLCSLLFLLIVALSIPSCTSSSSNFRRRLNSFASFSTIQISSSSTAQTTITGRKLSQRWRPRKRRWWWCRSRRLQLWVWIGQQLWWWASAGWQSFRR
ncbi:hypothetical protein NL676_021765 [Syzygium grande]|nr:hypothetical protein NL676_021765 [Syzygium grande]